MCIAFGRDSGHQTIRLKNQFGHDYFPCIAFDGVLIRRFRCFSTPPDYGQHGGGAAPGPRRRLETPSESSYDHALFIQQFPASLARDARIERIARRKTGDCIVDRLACFKASRETKVHVPQAGPKVAVFERRRAGWKLYRFAAYHGGMACQFVREPVGLVEPREHQRLAGARHGHVVQPARRIPVFVASDAIPAAVQHCNVIEFQSLGAMRCQQQESTLATAHLPAPLRQPFDEVIDRRFPASAFQRVFLYGLAQQVAPGAGGT